MVCIFIFHCVTVQAENRRLFGGGQVGAPTWSEGTGSIFAEYVLLASHNPYPIIVSFVANYI